MVAEQQQGLTRILGRARAGDEGARDELVALVYDELRRVASSLMRRERPDHTLSPTAVVHEAVIRLLGDAAFDRAVDDFEEQGLDVVAVHEALDRLAERDGRQAQVMTLRYFGGMTVPEVAAALGVSAVTVERDWRLARAWLAGQLGGGDG